MFKLKSIWSVEMRLNPKEEYLINKCFETAIKYCLEYCSDNTKKEIAISLFNDGYSIEKVVVN